jgi:hypothetical protein
MYGDLPEDFRCMRDRRENYNRPIKMRRNEMGIRVVMSRKKRVRTYRVACEGGEHQPGSKGAELARLRAETITSGGSAGTADPPGTGLRGLEDEAEGTTVSKLDDRSFFRFEAHASFRQEFSEYEGDIRISEEEIRGGVLIDDLKVALVPNVLEPGTVVYEMHHRAWCLPHGQKCDSSGRSFLKRVE